MTNTYRRLLTIPALATISGTLFATPDERFLRMWEISQRARPSVVTAVSRIAAENEPGTRLVIHGVVVDTHGRPAAGVEVFAYHTDAGGTYAQPGATAPWRLKGWAVTDAQDRLEFQTIRPAPYPGRDVPAHVHATLTAACCGRQFDDLMFEDDPRAADGTEDVSYTIRIQEHGNF